MAFEFKKLHLVGAAAVAAGLFLAFDSETVSEIAPESSAAGEDGPRCGPDPWNEKYDFDKVVSTPDVSFDKAGLMEIKKNGGWFVVNRGTLVDPYYQLFRLSGDGSMARAGQYIPDLSLLGPDSIPEVSERDLLNRYDTVKISAAKVTEKEMGGFYKLPDHPIFKVPPEYRARLAERTGLLDAPLIGPEGARADDLENLKKIIFDKTEVYDEVPTGEESGSACTRPKFASASINGPENPGKMILKLFPLFENASPETKAWLLGHESGHGLSFILGLEGDINKLPSWQRATILMQLEAFQE